MANLKVLLHKRANILPGEIDALDYLKRKGEHLLAVNVQKYRKGEIPCWQVSADLHDLCTMNEDQLINN